MIYNKNTRQLFSIAIIAFILVVTGYTQTRQRRATPSPQSAPPQTTNQEPRTDGDAQRGQSGNRQTAPSIRSNLPPPPPPPPKPTPEPEPAPSETIVDEGDEITISSKLVAVPVSVSDEQGNPVRGLTIADFQLDEKGTRQQITELGDAEEIPLEMALLIDVSGSVKGSFEFELEAAARFLRRVMKPADRVTLYAIDSAPRRLGARMTTEEAAALVKTIKLKNEFTAFFDSVTEAAEQLAANAPPRTRRVIICLSDGDDTYSARLLSRFDKQLAAGKNSVEDLRQTQAQVFASLLKLTLPQVQSADAVFYSINPSGNSIYLNVAARRGQDGMKQLSEATGGTSFLPNVIEDLDTVFNRIATELRAQYLIQYYSNNKAQTGEFLPITVRAPAKNNLRLRARQGYYSK